MKIRSGFVSNSSSSSFTCDVCGETRSGYDMSRRDAGMAKCQNGHTYCESHGESPSLTIEEKRQRLIDMTMARKYYKPEENTKRAEEIRAYDDITVEDEFDEYNNDEEFLDFCPICQLKEMADWDVIAYALIKLGYPNRDALTAAVKAEFGTFEKLQSYLKENKKS